MSGIRFDHPKRFETYNNFTITVLEIKGTGPVTDCKEYSYGQIVHDNEDLLPDYQEELHRQLQQEELQKMFPHFNFTNSNTTGE